MKHATGGRSVLVCDQVGVVSVMHCLDAATIADEGFQQRYPQEAAVLAGFDEPRVAIPRGYVVDAGGWIVASVRGHVEGVSLTALLGGQARGLDTQTAATLAKDVLTALAALHRGGIAHRSVAADQVIVQTDGTCVLIHAGLAPRDDGRDRSGELAADLNAVGELFAVCLGGRRAAARPGAHRARSATRQAGDMAEYLFALLTGSMLAKVPADERTVSVLAVLDSAMLDHFGPGWEKQGRDSLAARAQTVRRTRPRRSTSAAWARLRAGLAGSGRHATEGAASHARAPRRRLIRYGGPLVAFTVVFTLVLVVASHATTWGGGLQAGPTRVVAQPDAVFSSPPPRGPNALAVNNAQPSPGSRPHVAAASDARTFHKNDMTASHRLCGSRSRSR